MEKALKDMTNKELVDELINLTRLIIVGSKLKSVPSIIRDRDNIRNEILSRMVKPT
ncbi:MAG TPA: hypothetical protein PK367_00675 [Candidatus Paceibacterota bacterium]|nr:hypothetical protein [Candidatus Paceibacterota bacterium]